MKGLAATFILFLLIAGHEPPTSLKAPVHSQEDSIVAVVPQAVVIPAPDSILVEIEKEEPAIKTGTLDPNTLVAFSKTLIGTPYLYGSIDPRKGFDCSGFITYVFNHFKVKVPRSSVEFTDVGKEINFQTSKPGDLILFTGTDSTIRTVGHMGIVVNNENNKLFFIHSTSGKKLGVTITELSPYYMSRFVRVARIFPEEASTSIAALKRENEGYTEGRATKESPQSPGMKKTSKLKTSKKVDSAKSVKSRSAVKKSPVKKTTSGKSKSTVVKKSSVKKPATPASKSIKKAPVKKKTSTPQKTTTKTVS